MNKHETQRNVGYGMWVTGELAAEGEARVCISNEDEEGIEEDDELVYTIDCHLVGAVTEDKWREACDNVE
ncbi:hypothetical protein NDU88_007279 [Pleurodeles waltl]|uniref:Uncharacterized protein n=1 Tax=Pleurodeles waltl TaxID=8319 RepID=A0AAV7LRM2_PLEWA|nr:hypothetical protein NDU88_007279 [Pleurodeles waltl]